VTICKPSGAVVGRDVRCLTVPSRCPQNTRGLPLSDKPLTDNQVDDLLKAAREILGHGRGETTAGNTALVTARGAMMLLSHGLIAAGLKRLSTLDRR
jgi:hypothetical protein